MAVAPSGESGPSSDAWGTPLTAPWLVTHQGVLVAFARAAGAATDTLYFQVIDPQAAMNAADEAAWNGWYRFEFPEAPALAPGNERWREQQAPPELRLAGMDLLTVTPSAEAVQPADAGFQVFSDDRYLYCFRPSKAGTLYLTRLMLLSRKEQVSKRELTLYALEVAWEVRYQRSGVRDVPYDDSDTQSYLDLVGEPFYEPTLELSQITGIEAGAYAVARVPTADSARVVWYVARADDSGVQLFRFSQDDGSLTNFTESPQPYTKIVPTLAPGGGSLPPIPGLAPALLFYAEQDTATAASGEQVELPRAGRLLLAIPVGGAGLAAATAIYDFSLDTEGSIPDLPSDQQSLVLVDGTIESGAFVPDTTSPSFPTPTQAASTVHVVDGLTVDSMLLGQVQPHGDLVLRMGEDGLVHLYYGGPLATELEATVGWYALVPGLPMAMVAQFDPRVSRVVIAVPWRHSEPSEQPAGSTYFSARQSGAVMSGAQVAVSDVTFGSGEDAQPQPDLCSVALTYPSSTGLPAETWTGVPREVESFAAVLNGAASDDSADPDVVAGNEIFFDFSGKLCLARVPLLMPGSQPPPSTGPYAPVFTFVSTRTSLSLTQLTVTSASAGTEVALSFKDGAGHVLEQTWTKLPAVVDAYPDIFGGSASFAAYDYVRGPGTTPLFALATDAFGVPAPLLLYPTGLGPDVAGLKITVARSATTEGALDVTFDNGTPGPIVVEAVPAAVGDFAKKLEADAGFQTLLLQIDTEGVAGAILPTAGPTEAVDLRGAAALFDLVGPADDVTGFVAKEGPYTAGNTGRTPHESQATRMVGFVATYDAPEPGAPAYVVGQPASGPSGANRELAGRTDAGVAQSGAWVRQTPHAACSFSGADSMTVPVAVGGAIVPQSASLRPQWDWTLEAWLLPSGSEEQRLVTFRDEITQVSAHAPQLDYSVALVGAHVLQFGSYTKRPGVPDSSFFLTGTAASVPFLRAGSFTWEVWIQPTATPAPPGTASPPLLGGVIQVGIPGQANAAFSIGLTADRHVVVRVASSDGSTTRDLTSTGTVTDDDGDGLPEWTHVAVVATQGEDGTWTVLLYIDAVLDATFRAVSIQANDPRGMLTIGRNTVDDASMFGELAQLRLWSTGRTESEIRRTAFTSLAGTEAGLLGCWPMAEIASGARGRYLENIAFATGSDWDATLNDFTQPVATAEDDVFLSVVASVAGLPAIEAQTLLVNGRWNHLALVFRAGGALELNPATRFEAGTYDWMRADGENLGPASAFAIDAWVTIPAPTPLAGTIAARWAWDEAPEDQSYMLQVDAEGNLALTVNVIVDELGTVEQLSLTSAGVDLADGKPHHVAAVFTGIPPDGSEGSTASYKMSLYGGGHEVGSKTNPLKGQTVQVQSSQADFLAGRSWQAPEGAEPQPVESLGLFQGILGRLRFWSSSPSIAQLFPETVDAVPTFGPPAGLAAEWDFGEQQGRIAADSVGGNDGELTSSALWSSLRDTSTLMFYANGGLVSGVRPSDGAFVPASTSQFNLGAPAESGVAGLSGKIAQVSLWGAARSLETIRDQQFVPLGGDEQDLLACWDFAAGGTDITGGGNDASPPIKSTRITPSTVPVTNEGSAILNAYGGVIGELTECTPGRMAVGAYVDIQQAGTQTPLAVLKRQYIFDPIASLGRPIQVGVLDLVYIGQVQTRPTLIGYIEGAPPVPSENLTRPYYQSGMAYTGYADTASVALVQQGADRVTYSSSSVSSGAVDFRGALGIFGVKQRKTLNVLFMSSEVYDLKNVVQGVANAHLAWGTEEGEQVAADWTAQQRDQASVSGEWEPFRQDADKYLSPQVGRRFVPSNLGYALVESLTADLYATVFHNTRAAVGTIVIPNLGIPPDRNVLTFPIDGHNYVKAGTLDGKVGLANDPDWQGADTRRGSYFRPAEAYALAASIDQANERNRSYASQFEWESRGKRGQAGLEDTRGRLPVDFEQAPRDEGQVAVPTTGIANRYVWTADGGLHAEEQGYAAVASRSHAGFTQRSFGGGLHGEGQFFVLGLGWQWSLDLMAQHNLEVHVGVSEEKEQSVSLDVSVRGEAYLHRWDPFVDNVYGSKGAYEPDLAPGKVNAYRFMSIFLPPSTANSGTFAKIVDPVWKRLSNDPAARALRELDVSNPVWRVLHRVTYVERVPPRVASRPLFTGASDVREPVNVDGNVELLRLIDTALGKNVVPAPAKVGGAVATVLNPAPTAPGQYPPSVLEGLVPWWRTFLDSARPQPDGSTADPAAAELLATLVTEVVDYAIAGYQTGVIQARLRPGPPTATPPGSERRPSAATRTAGGDAGRDRVVGVST